MKRAAKESSKRSFHGFPRVTQGRRQEPVPGVLITPVIDIGGPTKVGYYKAEHFLNISL